MKIVVSGNYGANNIGDEMILEGLLCSIKTVAPKAEITVLSGEPGKTAEIHQVKSVGKYPSGIRSLLKSAFRKKPTKQAVKECDYFILGGGGLFSSLEYKSYFIWGIQTFMAYKNKKKVIMYGQSLEPITCTFLGKIIKYLFRKSQLIAVRDKISKFALRQVDVNNDIHLIPDLAFRVNHTKKSNRRDNEVIVALRQIDNLRPSFKKNIATFLDKLVKRENLKIKFINFQTEALTSDSRIHKEVIDLMKNKEAIEYIAKIDDPRELLKQLSKAKMVLGMRLHSIIASIKAETPFIAINYAPKVESFLKSNNLGSTMLNMNNIGVAHLEQQFKKIMKDYSDFENKLCKFNETALVRLEDFENKVLKPILI